MINKLACFVFFILLSQSGFARERPEKCPEVATIKSVTIENIVPPDSAVDVWTGSVTSQFDTNVTWELMGILWHPWDAKDENDAREKINTRIRSIDLVSGPVPVNYGQTWECFYLSPLAMDGAVAIAITPP